MPAIPVCCRERIIVSGRSKPAIEGRLKTSHFEEPQVRWSGSKG